MLNDFKKFALRGNVMDLAVAVVIGAAFGRIVTSFVSDVLMPPLGKLTGQVDFSNLFLDLSGGGYSTLTAAKAAGAPTLNYGVFINTVLDFLIIAVAVFLVSRPLERLKAKPEPTSNKECPFCISQIPLKATRCPACTSALDSDGRAAA